MRREFTLLFLLIGAVITKPLEEEEESENPERTGEEQDDINNIRTPANNMDDLSSGKEENKEKEQDKVDGNLAQDISGLSDTGFKQPDDIEGPTPTTTGKTKTPPNEPTGKTTAPSKPLTTKQSDEVDKKDRISDSVEVTTIKPTTIKSTRHITSPSPTSPTPHPKSTPAPTIIKRASEPTSPKPTTFLSTLKQKTSTIRAHISTPVSMSSPTAKHSVTTVTKSTTSESPKYKPQPLSDADARSKINHVSDLYGQTVEKSNNNTLKMNGTTFRVAVRLLEEKWTEDLIYQKNPVFQNLKKTVMSSVAIVYDGYHDFKQIAIIGFTETPANDSDADKRDSIGGNSVIADFYLRFFSWGRHLKKLTDAIKNEKIGSLTVSPKFVKAYIAEPKGRVCTPDCKLKCYSYCDDGCCSGNYARNDLFPNLGEQKNDFHHMKWSSAPIAPRSQPMENNPVLQKGFDDMEPRSTKCNNHNQGCFIGSESTPGFLPIFSNHCNGDKLCEDILSQDTLLHFTHSGRSHHPGLASNTDSDLEKLSQLLTHHERAENDLLMSSLSNKKIHGEAFGMDGTERSIIPEKQRLTKLNSFPFMHSPDGGSCRTGCANDCFPTCLNDCCHFGNSKFDKGNNLW